MRRIILAIALALAAAGGLLAWTPPSSAEEGTGSTSPALQPPDGHRLALTTHGTGVQIYDCVDGAWKFREPAAVILKDSQPVAVHNAGPTWQSAKDGSKVTAKVKANEPSRHPDRDVPLLLLESTGNRGPGVLEHVRFIQRLDTHGGVAPSGSCDAGRQPSTSVKYTATYTFWVPERSG